MNINMSIAPEKVPEQIVELTKEMHLERGGIIQFLRTDAKRNIWTMKVTRIGRNLHFRDWNKSTELKVKGEEINKIINNLRKVVSCVIDEHSTVGSMDHVYHYQ
ncbi:MAG: hypothetical protein WAV11_03605, partial [Minisyncoccia bacterium]